MCGGGGIISSVKVCTPDTDLAGYRISGVAGYPANFFAFSKLFYVVETTAHLRSTVVERF